MFWFGKNKTPITGQRILIVSDIHFKLSSQERKVFDQEFTQVWVLGDVPRDVLLLIDKMKCPKFGVLGNHDVPSSFDGFSIINLHGDIQECRGWTLVGIAGSSKYKDGPYVMITQHESKKVADKLPRADILLTHDSMYQTHDDAPNKEGLQGITRYIDEHHPLLHVYGHHHEYKQYKHGKTICICNYRLGIIETNGVYYQRNET